MTAEYSPTTKKQAEAWKVAMPLLRAMFSEIKELSKKKPDAPISPAKIRVINRLLTTCRQVLKGEASLGFLDLIEEDDVPQPSDVTLMLSQYEAAMERFQSQHHGWNGIDHTWHLK